MKWTPEMIAAVKGNEVPHGILMRAGTAHIIQQGDSFYTISYLIEQAHKEGAEIDYWYDNQWRKVDDPSWYNGTVFRVASDWQPKPEEPPKMPENLGVVRYAGLWRGQEIYVTETYGPDGHLISQTAKVGYP